MYKTMNLQDHLLQSEKKYINTILKNYMVQYLDISGQLNSIKLISPVSFYFNITARQFKIVYMLCILVLDSASSAR